MSDANATDGAVGEQKVAPEANTQPSSTEVESVAVESDTSQKDVAVETPEGSSQEDLDWYKEREKQLKAENARRREKAKKDAEKLEQAKARIEALEAGRPTLESVGGDHDALERAERKHDAQMGYAEERYQEVAMTSPQEDVEGQKAVQAANQAYIERIRGDLALEGAVKPQAYEKKEALFDEFLSMRPLREQAEIITALVEMDKPMDVIMNVADDSESLTKLGTVPFYDIGSVLRNAKPVVRQQVDAPPPVPEVGGSTGSLDGYDMDTLEGVRAWKKDNGIR